MTKFFWNFKNNDALRGKIRFGIRSNISDYQVFLDGDSLFRLDDTSHVTIKYDSVGINSENNCRASNYMYLNGEWIGRLPFDGHVGKSIPNETVMPGVNTLRIIIGGYWGDGIYDVNKPHGVAFQGLYKDDFQIGNLRLVDESGYQCPPYKMVLYKPKAVGKIGYNTYEVAPTKKLMWMGDGSHGCESYDGHPNPRYDIPFQIDFHFDYEVTPYLHLYELDTTKYESGNHLLSVKCNNQVVLETMVLIDNDLPDIFINIDDDETISPNHEFVVKITDATSQIVESYLKLDGKLVDKFDASSLSYGLHNLVIYACDFAGNEKFHYVNFKVADINIKSLEDIHYEITSSGDVDLIKLFATTPFNLYYEGDCHENEKIIIEAFNFKKDRFDVLDIFFKKSVVKITDEYISQHILIRASQYKLDNGSDSILWMTDTQHLTRFPDLFKYNKFLTTHAKDEYEKGAIGYTVHTGDIVDLPPPSLEAYNQWLLVDDAFKVLDENQIPYGIAPGNHDVDSQLDNLNYSFYTEFFGTHRFNQKPYFGGALNDNESHYDLVTISGHDFILLYLGYGLEKKNETVMWANKVLNKYRHRTAIICVHSYLSSITGGLDEYSQAHDIYNRIIIPNDNVRLLLCGHHDGAVSNKKQIGNRLFYEIMACYQFVELSKWEHPHLAGVIPTCNGEGYMRKMRFINGKMHSTTYSPITHGPMPFGEKDDFWIEFPLIKNKHFIKTKLIKKINEQ